MGRTTLRRVIDHPAAPQQADESLDLIDRDRVTDADVYAAALFKGATAIDADEATSPPPVPAGAQTA